ncbi:MAG: hypothetical protein ABH879_08265 [archaeon]
MANKEQEKPKETLEIPKKIGFGRDAWELYEQLPKKIGYAKFGRGSDEIIFLISDLKSKDPELKLTQEDKRLIVDFSREFDVQPFLATRKLAEMSDRERKRKGEIVEALIETFNDAEDYYPEEELQQKIKEFPKLRKYLTDDEDESFFLKDGKEIWIEESIWTRKGELAVELAKAYFQLKELERGSEEYTSKFEQFAAQLI